MNHFQREFTARLPEPVPCPADIDLRLYRQRIEAAIELLMAELDRLGGDGDLEDDDPAEDSDHGELNGDDEYYLAGATTDLEGDDAYYDCPLPIEGGLGL